MRKVAYLAATSLSLLAMTVSVDGQSTETRQPAFVLTGTGLLDECRRYENACDFYLDGVMDGEDAISTYSNPAFCLSAGVTAGQVNVIVSRYMQRAPEMWSNPAAVIVRQALSKAFPCGSTPHQRMVYLFGSTLMETLYDRNGGFSAYINGVVDEAYEGHSSAMTFCLPEHASLNQIDAVVLNAIHDAPETWSDPAANLIINALAKAFPCR